MRKTVIQAADNDSVVVAVSALNRGQEVLLPDGSTVTALDDIPQFHKMAIVDVPTGGKVYRYGEEIGYATQPIQRGQWVHTHNIDSLKMM